MDYSQQYLTFVALETGTFNFSGNTVQYSLDSGTTWTSLSSNTNTPTVQSGERIMWKATGLTPNSTSGIGKFSSTGNYNVEGNIMSLYYGDNFQNEKNLSGKSYAFYMLFYNSTKLLNAENLSLPATTLSSHCYNRLLAGCAGLLTAPKLPAMTLADNCYRSMMQDCTSLTTTPELLAPTLVENCYYGIFNRSSSVNYIKCLATDISASNCLYNWVQSVSSSGTFVKASGITWTTGNSGIPTNWTVVEYDPFNVDVDTISAPATGGVFTVTLNSDLPWSLMLTDTFFTVSPDSGMSGTTLLTVNVEQNFGNARSGHFYIVDDELAEIEVMVSQEKAPILVPFKSIYRGGNRIT